MAGVTDGVFRSIARRFGADLSFTEMVSAKGLHYNSENTAELLEQCGVHPEGVQIFGSDPEIMAEQLKSDIFDGFDIIDINMGCPAKKIVSNGEGSALMKTPLLAQKIVLACKKATSKPITVKFRAGWDSFTAADFAQGIESAGADAITIHGRTTQQAYSGKADLNIIMQVKKQVRIPVIGNGDITDACSAERMFSLTGCDAVMIGRAAQGRPWIFKEIRDAFNGVSFVIENEEKLEIAREHGIKLAALRGEHIAMLQMRKHLSWYTHGFKNAANIRNMIHSVCTLEQFNELIDAIKKQCN